MKNCNNDECGVRRMGKQRRKGIIGGVNKLVWWWPKRKELVRIGYREEIGLHSYDRYHRKHSVKALKRMTDWRWGERLGNDFEGNKKMFWREVRRVRKGEQARDEMVKDANGQISRDGVEVRRRWAEYFELVLNV